MVVKKQIPNKICFKIQKPVQIQSNLYITATEVSLKKFPVMSSCPLYTGFNYTHYSLKGENKTDLLYSCAL